MLLGEQCNIVILIVVLLVYCLSVDMGSDVILADMFEDQYYTHFASESALLVQCPKT